MTNRFRTLTRLPVSMFTALASLLSPAGPRARLSTLIFHRVLRTPDALQPGEVHALQFDAICRWVKDWFCVMPLLEAAERLAGGTLPARALAITFDDGYADNEEVALPILRTHGLPASFFVATGFIGDGVMWNDEITEAIRRTSADHVDTSTIEGLEATRLELGSDAQRRAALQWILPRVKYMLPQGRRVAIDGLMRVTRSPRAQGVMMSERQIVDLHRAGMTIGAHTCNHPILATLDDDAARNEIAQGRARLESLLDTRVDAFAYPNGKADQDYGVSTVQIVRELGFRTAVTTNWGSASTGLDPMQLPRYTPWRRNRAGFGAQLLSNLRRDPVVMR